MPQTTPSMAKSASQIDISEADFKKATVRSKPVSKKQQAQAQPLKAAKSGKNMNKNLRTNSLQRNNQRRLWILLRAGTLNSFLSQNYSS